MYFFGESSGFNPHVRKKKLKPFVERNSFFIVSCQPHLYQKSTFYQFFQRKKEKENPGTADLLV